MYVNFAIRKILQEQLPVNKFEILSAKRDKDGVYKVEAQDDRFIYFLCFQVGRDDVKVLYYDFKERV
ncbi:hypothetical protein Hydth_0513 [Hydrogenobacter thermophilus TK-6]|uniref:Uncharacterized protein n=1 Tax=Hydrogenobacter thermophilus (strain DSM 6534 / IAM 12695 / TK-6) TaxID=608538 RepID=D3DGM7_HYDTT|nr:hypothetical protein [Hydrogenobacter thermophilus]ADO44913.1 hypothetical protein Hydth_0513 [Hydrogenobacter thermophilus TK-6]BAI68979.1 hypothetical protein HTH_0515 [Hydrogenobacter thermophilus TK-6]